MTVQLDMRFCAKCGQEFAYGENVIPVWIITHNGRVHMDATQTRQMAHLTCPDKENQE